MPRTSAAGNKVHRSGTRCLNQGFTLLELLIALGIAALVAALTLPALRPSTAVALRSSSQIVANALRQTRLDAMQSLRPAALIIDTQSNTLNRRDKQEQISPTIHLHLTTAEKEMLNTHRGGIRFWPDGSASGGRVTLAADTQTLQIDVEWLTGRIRIREADN